MFLIPNLLSTQTLICLPDQLLLRLLDEWLGNLLQLFPTPEQPNIDNDIFPCLLHSLRFYPAAHR